MIKKQFVKSRNVTKVTFELPAEIDADQVFLVADVNRWQPRPFERLKNGKWRLVEEFEPNRAVQFRYKLLRGGEEDYLNDPESDSTVANDQGSENAVIKL